MKRKVNTVKKETPEDDEDLTGYDEFNPTLKNLVSFEDFGDTLEGIVKGIRKTQYGDSLVVESDGEEYLTPNLTTLTDFVEEVRGLMNTGNKVRIKLIYTEDGKGGYGKPYKIFKKGIKVIE